MTFWQYGAVPYLVNDMNVLCGSLSSVTHCTQHVLKILLINVEKKKLIHHLVETNKIQRKINEMKKKIILYIQFKLISICS